MRGKSPDQTSPEKRRGGETTIRFDRLVFFVVDKPLQFDLGPILRKKEGQGHPTRRVHAAWTEESGPRTSEADPSQKPCGEKEDSVGVTENIRD